ncbi:hypothetical protein N9B12_01645 [bacterium]|nr:hypothetical protein [bacterium]
MFSDDLVSDLREATARNNRQELREDGLCGIVVGSEDEMHQSHRTPICEVDFPPLDGVDKTKLYLGIWWNDAYDPRPKTDGEGKLLPFVPGERKPSPCAIASQEFLALADRLGASLPLETRRSFGDELEIPFCAIWCLLLYREFALQHEDRTYIRYWQQPFGSSLSLAEQLNTGITHNPRKLPDKPKGRRPKRAEKNDPFRIWELDLVTSCGRGGAKNAWEKNKNELQAKGIMTLVEFKQIYERRRKEAFSK